MSVHEPGPTTDAGITGSWRVDPTGGHLQFSAKGMWGLANVKGQFSSYDGTLQVDQSGAARGELTIAATSLDTKHTKRDAHLRSADFFDVERHPTIRFTPTAVATAEDGLTVTGDLEIGDKVASLQLPVTVTPLPDGGLRLHASTSVTRDKVGLTWNKGGMIRGDAHLDAELVLNPSV